MIWIIIYNNYVSLHTGPEDIYEGNPKLVLGLVWTLIGRYQIRSSGRSLSTKAALKEWLDTLIPEYGVHNFNTDWNDGRPLCGLVDRLQPGLCPNHRSLDPNNGLENCRKGMKLAEENFDIPPVLDPEDMTNPEVDDLSIMTYLSYFFEPAMVQLLDWIHKKIPERNIKNLSTDWNTGVSLAALIEACHAGLFPDWKELDPHKAKENLEKCIQLANDRLDIKCPVSAAALSDPKVDDIVVATYLSRFKYSKLLASADEVIVYPPNLKDGCGIVKQPIEFQVELGSTPEATLSHLIFAAKAPTSEAPVKVGKPQKSIATAVFIPQTSGKFIVSCILNDEQVSGCPMEVPVIDPAKWSLTADLPKALQVNKPVTIQVEGESYGSTPIITCESFVDPAEEDSRLELEPQPSSTSEGGPNDPTSSLGASGSAASVGRGSEKDKKNTRPEPPGSSIVTGLEKPAVVGEDFSFSLTPKQKGEVDVLIQGPTISYTPEIEEFDGQHSVNFIPEEAGMHSVDVTIGGKDVPGSPFPLSVVEERPTNENGEDRGNANKGLTGEGGDEGKDKSQTKGIDGPNDEEKLLQKAPEKPKEKAQFIKSSISPVEAGKCSIYLLPTGTGKAKTHVMIGGVDVENSPFSLSVIDSSQYSMSDLEGKTFLTNQEVKFDVNTKESDMNPEVTIQSPTSKYTPQVVPERSAEGKTYHYIFVPTEPGVVKVSVRMGGDHVPGSPCTIQVCEPSIISEIPRYLEVGKVYTLDVLVDNSLRQEPTTSVTNTDDETGSAPIIMDTSISKNESHSNHWKLLLKPLAPGSAIVEVKVGNFYHVKKSPFPVKITAISQCRVEGMENPLRLAQPFPLKVIVDEGLTQKPEVKIYTPSSNAVLSGNDNGDDSYTFSFTPIELGPVKIAILFGGEDIPGSPFSKLVESPSDAKNCQAYGPSLNPNAVLQTGRPIEFCVDCKKAGTGELQVVALGPRKHDPKVLVAEEKGEYTLRIDAPHPGWYHVHVWWSQVHIPNSPFRLKVHQASDPTKVRAFGPGVSSGIEVGRPAEFHILTKDAGMGTLTVSVYGVKDAFKVNVKPEDLSDPRTLLGVYHPNEAGEYRVIIKWSGTEIPGSPFHVTVTDKSFEIEKARLEERRKERMKRIDSQQRIIRQQNLAMQKAIQSMPDFRRNASLSMAKGGQFAGMVSGETTTQRMVQRHSRKKKLVRNVSAGAILQTTQSLSEMGGREKRARKVTAPSRMIKSAQSQDIVHPMPSKKKLHSMHSFESAMQRNAEFLGVHTPIGGSLRGGVAPMWHKSFATEENPSIDEEDVAHDLPTAPPQQNLHHQPPRAGLTGVQSVDLPDELPVSITPMYDNIAMEDELPPPPPLVPATGKKRSKRSSKKR